MVVPKSTVFLGLLHEISVDFSSFSPIWFCGALAERLEKELVYPHTRHKSHAYRLCQDRELHKQPLWLKRKGTREIEVVLCRLEIGSRQINCSSCWYTQGSLFM